MPLSPIKPTPTILSDPYQSRNLLVPDFATAPACEEQPAPPSHVEGHRIVGHRGETTAGGRESGAVPFSPSGLQAKADVGAIRGSFDASGHSTRSTDSENATWEQMTWRGSCTDSTRTVPSIADAHSGGSKGYRGTGGTSRSSTTIPTGTMSERHELSAHGPSDAARGAALPSADNECPL